MKTIVCLLVIFAVANAFPGKGHLLAPRAVMFGGYVKPQGRSEIPVEADQQQDESQNVEAVQDAPTEEAVQENPADAPAQEDPAVPTKALANPQEDEDEEDEAVNARWPFGGRNVPSYNTFFPIVIGNSGKGRSGENGGFPAGGSTAIANSFSTGKGGVARSQATSFGNPALGALLKSLIAQRKAQQEQ